jgi:S1-C subfamily serine protease
MSLQPGWIGINAEAPHERIVRDDSAYIRYFGYPEIVSVEPNSPAERVGIERGDQLIAYDGADLRDREINLTRLLQPARRITITVRRDGEERQFPMVVARPPARVVQRLELTIPNGLPDSMPGHVLMLRNPAQVRKVFMFDGMDPASAPVAGARLTEIRNEELGHIFGVSRGVLVTEVFSDPARESGLRGGDVIVRADGQDLTTVAQLRRAVAAHDSDRSVELEIVRQKRTRSLTLRW